MDDHGVLAFIAYSSGPAKELAILEEERGELCDDYKDPSMLLYLLARHKVEPPPLFLTDQENRVI